jgi:hypothetical protein
MPPLESQVNEHHQPATTRIVIRNKKFVVHVPNSRCKYDEPVALILVNRDTRDYAVKLTRFRNKNTNTFVQESYLFTPASIPADPLNQVPAGKMAFIQRTVKSAIALATYEYFLELWDPTGAATFYAELDPDFDITP